MSWWKRALLGVLYGAVCLAIFLLTWARDRIEAELKGDGGAKEERHDSDVDYHPVWHA